MEVVCSSLPAELQRLLSTMRELDDRSQSAFSVSLLSPASSWICVGNVAIYIFRIDHGTVKYFTCSALQQFCTHHIIQSIM